ncbi:21447_t:CDS:1 [Gigaspora margarita]|uniref:21447_t:CDS:1 n=1 Tax=Gigaspora margarita TaxID=4874 RepID=A0ABM8VWF0_GIGMA|nr:21447_t:CDS:1 [Gigaspora margarita]
MVKAQAIVDKEYPKETRKNIKKLDLSNKNLEGFLKLEGFSNLEVLNCSNNLLTDIDFADLNPETLKEIDLKNNKLSARFLTCFSKFVNLKSISIDSSFQGSIEPLKNLVKLNNITIAGTNIDHGLEYLPVSVISIGFDGISSEYGTCTPSLPSICKNLGSQKIFAQLKEYFSLTYYTRDSEIHYDVYTTFYREKDALEAWRIENIFEYRKKKYEKLEQRIKDNYLSLKSRLTNLEKIFEQQIKPLELKKSIPPKIKEKKAEIIKTLHLGWDSNAYRHTEIKEMRNKLSDYKKLEQHLEEARNLIIALDDVKFICREDKKDVYKGAYKHHKTLEEVVGKMSHYYKNSSHEIYYYEIALRECVHGSTFVELAKHIAEIRKLTQILLGRQHKLRIV